MVSIAREATRNVKWWRDGKMIKRWCAAGMRNAERSFRRLKGDRQMPTFVAALAVTSKLLGRRAMLHESPERTSRRPPPGGRDWKLDARGALGPKP